MTEQDRIACIALSLVPGVGTITARKLLAHFPSPEDIFHAPTRKLLQIEKVGTVLVQTLKSHKHKLEEARAIYLDCHKKGIEALSLLDKTYPLRIREIEDCPTVLYTQGSANSEVPYIVSIVGTRKSTAYGKKVTRQIVEGLSELGTSIVSGLAFGIDTHAHKNALEFGLPTFAVLPTPLDQIYPAQNRELAQAIAAGGRMYSEYAPGTRVDVRNFPMRNRLIAALSPATIVVESAESGGGLITARAAQDYNREVFAVPGRLGDEASAGCLGLVQGNIAALFTGVSSFLEAMGWQTNGGSQKVAKPKKELPTHLTADQQNLLKLLITPQGLHVDDVSLRLGIRLNVLAGMLLTLEFEGLVVSLPGKKYRAADSLL